MTDNPTSEDLRKAVALLREGNLAAARLVLVDTVTQHPRDELGWFLLSFALTDPGHQRDCLERVLKINPGNSNARERLEKLGGVAPPEPIPQPVTPPFVAGEGETALSEPAPPMPVATAPEAAAAVAEPARMAVLGLPDERATPVFFEKEGEGGEEAPEEQEEEEAPEEEKEPQQAVSGPEAETTAAAVAAPGPVASAGTPAASAQQATRTRLRAAKPRREQAPGWMIAAIVVLSLIVVLGALDLGWTYYRSGTLGVRAGGTATSTQAVAVTTLPPTPVMVLPPAWTQTPTPTITATPTATPTPSITPTPPSPTPPSPSPTAKIS